MQREIKFRAWDTERGCWLPAECFIIHSYQFVIDIYHDHKPVEQTAIAFMQFTGLKDKNGKEIFEGDLLAAERGVIEVKWETFEGWWKAVWGAGFYIGEDPSHTTVIGNIYENSELLK